MARLDKLQFTPAAPLPKENDFRYLPDNTNLFCIIRVDELLASDYLKKLRKEIPEIDKEFGEVESLVRKEYGLEISNVDRMTMGTRLGKTGTRPISVFRLKKAVDVKAVLKAREGAGLKGGRALEYKEEKVGAVTWYVSTEKVLPEAFCFPNQTTVVFGSAHDLKPVLERNREPGLSATLQAALKEADSGATLMVALDVKAGFDALKPLLDLFKVHAERPEAIDAGSLSIKVGNDVALRGVVVCKDARAAEKVRKQAEAFRTAELAKLKEVPPGTFPKGVLDLPTRVKLSTRGNVVEATASLSPDLAIDRFKRKTAETAPDRYALDDTNVLFVIRMRQLLASSAFEKLRRGSLVIGLVDEGFRHAFGFGTNQIDRIVFGGNANRAGRFVAAVHLNTSVKAETILKARGQNQKLRAEKVGSFTLYAAATGGEGFCLADDRTLLLGRDTELKEVLARTRPANLSAGLQAALKQADPGAALTLALDSSALPAGRPGALPGVDLKRVIDNTRGAVLTVKLSGRDVTLHGVAVCRDTQGAKEVLKQAKAFRHFLSKQAAAAPARVPKEVAELPGKVTFATRGNLVETTLTVKDDTALALLKAFWLPDLDLKPKPTDGPGPPPRGPGPLPVAPKPPVEKKR